MTIKIDVDGVIRDILTPICKLYNEEHGEDITPDDFTEWGIENILTKEKDPCGKYFNVHCDYVFREGAKLIDGAKKKIDELREKGAFVLICTTQDKLKQKIATLRFLEENGIAYDGIVFTREKHLIKGDVLLDDSPENIEMNQRHCPKSLTVIIDHPYNKDVKETENTVRIKSISELRLKIRKKALTK